jgi:hypothetical protein
VFFTARNDVISKGFIPFYIEGTHGNTYIDWAAPALGLLDELVRQRMVDGYLQHEFKTYILEVRGELDGIIAPKPRAGSESTNESGQER